jgi:hypothetical protein
MTTSESFHALHRANPRAQAGFARSVEAAAEAARARIAATPPDVAHTPRAPRRRLVRLSAVGASLAVAVTAVSVLSGGSPGGGSGVESASAAVTRAASVTAASARESGTAAVRITHGGEVWAAATIRWHGDDLTLSRDAPQRRGKAGSEMRVVDGMMYGIDPVDGRGWVELGPVSSIDPGSGTTPAEYLAAVREDAGGATLRRIAGAMSGLTTRELDDGATVYGGTVPAGQIARESGFKQGEVIRVLPFGHVANDEASDPAAPLDVALTVLPGGTVRELAASWGTGDGAWRYAVTYSELGATPAVTAPAGAEPLKRALSGR